MFWGGGGDIRQSVEDRQSRLAWQIVNEISGRKSTSKLKLKATSQKDRLQKWKEHFQKRLGNPPKIIENNTQKIVDKQLVVGKVPLN